MFTIKNKLKITLLIISILGYISFALIGFKLGLYLGVLVGAILFLENIKSQVNFYLFFYIALSIFTYFLILVINTFNDGLFFLPIILSSIGISMTIFDTAISNRTFHLYVTNLILYGLIIYCLLFFMLYGDMNYALRGSRNMISVYLLLLLPYYFVVRHINNIIVSIYLPALVFVIAIISVSSSGIISTFLFLFLLLLKKKYIFHLLTFLLLILFFINNLSILDNIDNDLLLKFDFARLTGNDIRFYVLHDYISKLNLFSFIYGVPIASLNWYFINEEISNPHNSYLLWHAKSGIIFFIYISNLLMITYKLLQHDKILFFLFISILIRSFSDTIAFSHGYFEWSWFLLYLYAIKVGKSNQMTNCNTSIK